MSERQDKWLLTTFGIDPSAYAQPPAAEDPQADPAAGSAQDGAIGGMFDKLKEKLGFSKPVPRAALGGAQQSRADKLKTNMSPADKKKVDTLFGKAKGDETAYLTKALASGHSASELETFYAAIKGKNKKWMEDNLHVVGDSKGNGVMQQWSMTCAPTSVQAIKAELDPVYALKLRTENPDLDKANDSDGMAENPKLAQEQSDILASQGATAVPRDKAGPGLSVAGVETIFNDTKGQTGIQFKTEKVDDTTVDASLDKMAASLSGGLPVPLLVGANGKPGHAVLLTGVDPGPPRRFSIHDPGNGKTQTVTDADIKGKGMDISGWTEVTNFLEPSAVP